ncbi:inovirus Gp2 family protein [Candidatus Pseudothioglobus singularis]|nr:inovirus-type Gp2 protein [Candidatus Pseudothioglobus singularis]MDB4847248.1 inovirus Gp2 family protein [Candidatus Pseudothioglobus singularis]
MLTKTKSRMKEHNYCFYNFKEEELFINSSKTRGIYPNIVEKIVEQLDICLAIHKRVLVLRFDLSMDEYTGDNQTISIFLNRLKEKLFKLKKYRRIRNIGHAWAREVETVKTQHYHVALFLDGNKIQHPSALLQLIEAKWYKYGRLWIPKKEHVDDDGCFYFIDKKKEDFKEQRENAIYRLSYLGKTRGKGYKNVQAKNYSVSRLSR